jgi:5-deoxy-glucuronate isomerase
MHLLIKPRKDSPDIAAVTPQSAGWRYIGFSARELVPGATVSFLDNSNELCLVVFSGIVSVQIEDTVWKERRR